MTVNAGRFTALRAFPPGTSVLVATIGSEPPTAASLYTDNHTGTSAPNPVTADVLGSVSFFAVPGDVDLVASVEDTEYTVAVTVPADPTEAWPG